MRKMLNTLYLSKEKTYVSKMGNTMVLKSHDGTKKRLPLLNFEQIHCFGAITLSPHMVAACAEEGIGIAMYTFYGKFLCRMEGCESGNVLLRRTQYRIADDHEKNIEIGKMFVTSKIYNSKNILSRHVRNYGNDSEVEAAIKKLEASLRRVTVVQNRDELMGVEGEAAATYFGVFSKMLRRDWAKFNGRSRRPPLDNTNAVLSFIYSLITQECASALRGVGLDPYVGFLHVDRPGRVSLALDMVEEFRAYIADRLTLNLINREQLKEDDFILEASGAIRMTDEGRKTILVAYQEKKRDVIKHPYLGEDIEIGLLPHYQALLLSRYLRGDIDEYTPFRIN